MQNFEAKCLKIKIEKLEKEDFVIEEEIKEVILQDFDNITPKSCRQLLNDVGILILPKWDIASASIFYAIRKETATKYKIEEGAIQAHKGVKYSEDHKALVS